jgi:hypothetical protein
MRQFKSLYLIEHTDYFFGVMTIEPRTMRATLRYYIRIDYEVREFGLDDRYDVWESNIDAVLDKARTIASENHFELWTY